MDHKKILEDMGGEKAIAIFQKMLEIREFEEKIRFLFLEGKMPGTIHQYIGMEACGVGVCSVLEEGDVIASNHRPHGHAIARGISMDAMMAELYGKTTGCCSGKGGSMHMGDLGKGMLPSIAIVGGNIPLVMGMALAFKLRKEPRVAVSFFGDGASNEGAFHEGLNMAAVYKVPAIFVCENNQYGASTHIKKVLNIENIADRASAYGMKGDIADGMNVLEVYAHAKEAVERARKGDGPTLLELKTFRLCGHSRRDPNNYMTKEEKEHWKKKDPIPFYEKILLEEKVLEKGKVAEMKKDVEKRVEEAIQFGQTSPDPKPEDTYRGLYVSMEVPR
jgi:TPP-dependent pyruvate/acetoin dehydrogenase alpha subunit